MSPGNEAERQQPNRERHPINGTLEMTNTLDPSALYWASFNRFEIRLPGEAVADIAQSGSNDEAVAYWAPQIANEWPDRATPEFIAAELAEYGSWEESELMDHATNWQRLVWLAAWDIAESDEPDSSAPVSTQAA